MTLQGFGYVTGDGDGSANTTGIEVPLYRLASWCLLHAYGVLDTGTQRRGKEAANTTEPFIDFYVLSANWLHRDTAGARVRLINSVLVTRVSGRAPGVPLVI